MIALYIVGSLIIAFIVFFVVIFIIATIRVLKQSRIKTGRMIDAVGTGEQVFAVLERNGQKEFIK